ncbi:HNH endonuclease [Mycobacterium phage Hilltopfarm]|nr:HNH endonuclease [Mycobacterium phage Hilltopfarm]
MTDAPMSADGYVWDEKLTRQAIKQGRSMGLCEFHGDHPATDMHHRRNASQGGKWHPANIIHICRELHHEVTVNPEWAHSIGLTLWTGEDPADVPVQLGSLHLWLTDQLIAKAGVNA